MLALHGVGCKLNKAEMKRSEERGKGEGRVRALKETMMREGQERFISTAECC